jgi:hypothetical protein
LRLHNSSKTLIGGNFLRRTKALPATGILHRNENTITILSSTDPGARIDEPLNNSKESGSTFAIVKEPTVPACHRGVASQDSAF